MVAFAVNAAITPTFKSTVIVCDNGMDENLMITNPPQIYTPTPY